jgi:hypothetical protein
LRAERLARFPANPVSSVPLDSSTARHMASLKNRRPRNGVVSLHQSGRIISNDSNSNHLRKIKIHLKLLSR